MTVTQHFVIQLPTIPVLDEGEWSATMDREQAEALFQELGQSLYPNYQTTDDEPEEAEWPPQPEETEPDEPTGERLTVDQAERRLAAQQVLDRMVPARPQQNAGSGIGQAHI